MRNDLWTDPRVTGMADALEVGEATIIGGVFFLWTTADLHSVDGFLKGLSLRALDRRAGIPGLGAELCRVGWLSEHADGLQVENFDRHNSASAKRRAQDARRKASQRQQPPSSEHLPRRPQRSYQPSTSPHSPDTSPPPVQDTSAEHPQAVSSVSASAADETGTGAGARVRVRKELENPPPPPLLSADCAASESAPTAAWVAAVEAELLDLGIDDLSCLQDALAAGLIEPAIRELLRHYREHQQAQDWTPKALHYRLRTAKTTLPSDRGWPQPGPAAQRQQAQSEQQRQQQRQQAQREQQQAQREQQQAAERQRKALAAQTYDALDRQFGKILDNLSSAAAQQLAASVSSDLARRLLEKGDRKLRSIRGPLLGRLAGQRAEQLESELGPQLDQLPDKELQDLAAIAGTHCLQQVKAHEPLTGQLRHQLLLTLHEQTSQVTA